MIKVIINGEKIGYADDGKIQFKTENISEDDGIYSVGIAKKIVSLKKELHIEMSYPLEDTQWIPIGATEDPIEYKYNNGGILPSGNLLGSGTMYMSTDSDGLPVAVPEYNPSLYYNTPGKSSIANVLGIKEPGTAIIHPQLGGDEEHQRFIFTYCDDTYNVKVKVKAPKHTDKEIDALELPEPVKKEFKRHLSYWVPNIDNNIALVANKLPGAYQEEKHPVTGERYTLYHIIMNLNDIYMWSRDQIADWIESLDNVPVFETPKDEVSDAEYTILVNETRLPQGALEK